ncbi:kelch domain-containing protein 3 [Bacillus rossius redtenbacheri]|uniref:kelch domain-containing protein 3 n=1 Tax=Bacillus rossius redtenbacheri TaxID=93214 RepID=UPI002FDE71FF
MYWTVYLEGGPKRVNHAAVVVRDKIYSFGGYCTGDDYRAFRPIDIHILNTENYRWRVLPAPNRNDPQLKHTPFLRYGHTAVAYGEKIYVWGGRNDEESCNKLFCFDTAVLKWVSVSARGDTPGARDGHSACVIDHCMYVFGGFVENIERFSQDVHALNLQTFNWTLVQTRGEPPLYRDFHTATAIGHLMYIFGGRGDQNEPMVDHPDEVYCNKIMYFDTRTSRWHCPKTTGEVPVGRRSHSAFTFGNYLYIFGGFNGIRCEHFNDIYRFSPETNEWNAVHTFGKPPSKRRRQSCIVVGHRMFLFGGTSPISPNYTDVYYNHAGGFDDMDTADSKLMDHSDMYVLDFAPTLFMLCLLTVLENNLDTSTLPDIIKWEIRAMTTNNSITQVDQCSSSV